MKEAHTYIIDSSFGPIQIGIPPETIKTSINKGGRHFGGQKTFYFSKNQKFKNHNQFIHFSRQKLDYYQILVPAKKSFLLNTISLFPAKKNFDLFLENVPKYYILPPSLFSGTLNFGEIEFPIYFNFFMKKAFINPDNKILIIGMKSQLERVKTVFKESVFGPNEDELFLDEEISPSKKAQGYTLDLR